MSTSNIETINAKDKPIAEDFVYVYSEIEDGGFRKVSKEMLKILLGVATKLSELDNDQGFVEKSVADLENYYLKAETYSKDEIDNRISLIPKFNVQVVQSLPIKNISEETVYLLPSGNDADNLYTEYLYVNGLWEILGAQKIPKFEVTKESIEAALGYTPADNEKVGQLEEQINDFGGTVEITNDNPTKENTVLTICNDGEEVGIYTADEVDEIVKVLRTEIEARLVDGNEVAY